MIGSLKLIEDYKRDLSCEFEMKDLGLMHYFLGLEVWQSDREICLGKGKYAMEIFKRFRMQDCRPMSTPRVRNWNNIDALKKEVVDATLYRNLIGSLMYLENIWPNIFFFVNNLCQFIVDPRREL